MNSPLGIPIGGLLLLPEVFLISVLGTKVVWVEGAVAVGLFVAAVFLPLSLGKLIKRGKLFP